MTRQWSRTAQEACFKKYMGDTLQSWEIELLNTVPKSTKSDWNHCIENYGLIPMDRKRESREGAVLTNELMSELRKIVYTHPDLYLYEIADALEKAKDVRVSPKTIYSALKNRMGLTMRTAGKMAKTHDDEQRQYFLDELPRIVKNPNMAVWVDESAKAEDMFGHYENFDSFVSE